MKQLTPPWASTSALESGPELGKTKQSQGEEDTAIAMGPKWINYGIFTYMNGWFLW